MEFDYSDLILIKVPFLSKKKSNYNFQGKAYYIFDKTKNDLIGNFLQFEGEIFGGENWAKDYKSSKGNHKPDGYPKKHYDLRMEMFGYGKYLSGRKASIEMTHELSRINEHAKSNTVLGSIGFITGSNSTGSRKKFSASQIISSNLLYYGLRFASWFSNSFTTNNSLPLEAVEDAINNKIQEVELVDFVLGYCENNETSKWRASNTNVVDLFFLMNYDFLSEDERWKEFKKVTIIEEFLPKDDSNPGELFEIFNKIQKFDIPKAKLLLRSKFRTKSLQYWMKKGMSKDFIFQELDINDCEAAHIISINSLNDKIKNNSLTMKDLSKIMDKENSLFLDPTTHSLWDKKDKIIIKSDGTIKTISKDLPKKYNTASLDKKVIENIKVQNFLNQRNNE